MTAVSLFVDALTTIDCSYFDDQRGIVGESWIVDIVIRGVQNEQGMLMDFADVKRLIKQYIDTQVDHCFLVPVFSSAVNSIQDGARIEMQFGEGEFMEYEAPLEATAFIKAPCITKQYVVEHLRQGLATLLTNNILDFDLTLREEVIEGAYYHYSHGLKKHLGNCQRIVHGHRSKIIAYRQGCRDGVLESSIAKLFRDIYIVTAEDIQTTLERNGHQYYRIAYRSIQGAFALTFPVARCYVMEVESTVENIAVELAERYSKLLPGDSIKVVAYEGVSKGAIASGIKEEG